jgi:TetR/AcrR family transcriptional regulator, transcriptional repressor for nem operon
MRKSRDEKARTHQRIVETASARIREQGIEGPGVAEIMQAAGLTHGGFYKHFDSRDDLIAEAAGHAFACAERTLDKYANDERDPFAAWVDWYASEEHRDDAGAARCPVPVLAGDVPRARDDVRTRFTAVVELYIATLETMLGGGEDARRQATVAMSTLVGSLVLARAVDNDAISDELLRAAREVLKAPPAPTR